MDCREASSLLPLLTRTDEPVAELRAVREHLAGCPACQAIFDAELRSDREFSERMLAVPIPTELHARLSREFAAIHRPPQRKSLASSARRRWATALLIVPLIVVIGFLSWWLLRPARVPLGDVVAAIDSREISDSWKPETGFDGPAGWSQVRGLQADAARWAPALPVAARGIRFTFQPARSGSPVPGQLWILDAKSITDAPEIPALELAQIRYTPGQPHLVWSERGTIYVLTTSGDVAALERLQGALRKSRSIA